MDTQSKERLKRKYPFIKCSISCGEGWFDVIDELCHELNVLNVKGFRIITISQKLGALNVIFSVSAGENSSEIRRLNYEAGEKSLKTCENCGNPGRLKDEKGRCRTLCGVCKDVEYSP